MKYPMTVPALLMLGMLPWAALDAQQTTTSTFKVTARVQAVCAVTANDLDFGQYNSRAASPHNVTSLLRVTCTPDQGYQVHLNKGTSPGASINQRRMISGASVLNYQLYRDSARLSIWGETAGTDTVYGLGTGLAQDHTVYGQIPPAQVVPAKEYTDTITVTVSY